MIRRALLAGLFFVCAGTLPVGATGLLSQAQDLLPDKEQFLPDQAELEADADATLARLYDTQPAARDLSETAKGILVFPSIVKGGFLVGGAGGAGVLRVGEETTGTYQSVAVSYGFQAGISKFGYVVFFLDEASLGYLDDSAGWEVGVGPNVTIADEGIAKKLSTTTVQDGVVVFFTNQTGFFAGAGIEGTKITRVR